VRFPISGPSTLRHGTRPGVLWPGCRQRESVAANRGSKKTRVKYSVTPSQITWAYHGDEDRMSFGSALKTAVINVHGVSEGDRVKVGAGLAERPQTVTVRRILRRGRPRAAPLGTARGHFRRF